MPYHGDCGNAEIAVPLPTETSSIGEYRHRLGNSSKLDCTRLALSLQH